MKQPLTKAIDLIPGWSKGYLCRQSHCQQNSTGSGRTDWIYYQHAC